MVGKINGNGTMEIEDNEDLVINCRKLAGKGEYGLIFEKINKNPILLNYFTIGELGRYVHAGIYNTIPLEEIKKFKKNIEGILFKGEKI